MTDDDRAGLAAEYVLGTLDADERDEADALIVRDPAFAAQVAAWERRLGELDTMVDPVTPPAAIWMALRARLSEPAAEPPPVSESVAPEPPVAPAPAAPITPPVTAPAPVVAPPAIPPADVTPGPADLPAPVAPEVPIASPAAPTPPPPSPTPPFEPIPAELVAPEVAGSDRAPAPEPAHEPAYEPTPAPAASPPDVLRAVAEALAMPLADAEGRSATAPAAATATGKTAPASPTPIATDDPETAAANPSAEASSRDGMPSPVGDVRAGAAGGVAGGEINVAALDLRAGDPGGSIGAGAAPDIKIQPDDDFAVPGYPRGPAGGPDIGPKTGSLDTSAGGSLIPLPVRGDDETVRRLVRSVQRWRSVAVGLLAFVLALAGLAAAALFAPEWLPPELRLVPGRVEIREVVRTVTAPAPAAPSLPPAPAAPAPAAPETDPARHVAVLQAEGTTPAFIVSLQPDRKSLMVRRVKAADEGDKRYELWLVSDKYPAPRSLGLLGTADFTIVPAVADFPPDVITTAVYAVSLEAETGSPNDGPSTPVIASGRLIEAVPEMPAAAPSGNGAP